MSQPAMKSPGQGHSYKEVRFSQPLVPIRRARSIASSNPLLDPAHQAERAAQKARKEKTTTYSEYAVYINQSRSLLESQRLNFERERLVFAEERQLWDMERRMLNARIAELESATPNSNIQSRVAFLNPDYNSLHANPPSFRASDHQNQHRHVWEGPIPGSRRPTRVFPTDDDSEGKKTNFYIAPTEANGFGLPTSLDAALSPNLFDRSEEVSIPVPIEKVDSRLDGITLKSTALPPDVVAKVLTPPTSLSPTSSPPKGETDSSGSTTASAVKSPSPLKLKLTDLGPPHENLVRDAGHTPMAILGTETDDSRQSPKEASEEEEEEEDTETEEQDPRAPAAIKQPTENGGSYFPAVVPDDDPALTGPLTLLNDEKSDTRFLSQLDEKLLDEAKRAVSGRRQSAAKAGEDQQEDDDAAGNEPDPGLKLKPSTNFGTAFGQC